VTTYPILETLTDEQLDIIWRNRAEDPDLRGEAALEVGRRKGEARDAAHAAFHGRERVKMVKVEARRGYKGEWVCGDCYYRKAWDGLE